MTGPAPPPELLGIALPSTWLDWIRLVAFLFTGPVVLFGAWLAWRRTRAAGIQADVSAQRQITETFSRAVEHLGNQEAVAVRIGAIYALERIAKTTPEEHWQVMETLAAFVRERAPRKLERQPVAEETDDPDDHGTSDEPARTDVEAALTVICRRETGREAEHQRIDLRETNLDGLELSGARLPGARLTLASMSSANLIGADLRGADLTAADMSFAYLSKAQLSGAEARKVDLTYASLQDADLQDANLEESVLLGADLSDADLKGANLFKAILSEAKLAGADLTGANLEGADLSGADLTDADGITEDQLQSAHARKDSPPRLPIGLEHVQLIPGTK